MARTTSHSSTAQASMKLPAAAATTGRPDRIARRRALVSWGPEWWRGHAWAGISQELAGRTATGLVTTSPRRRRRPTHRTDPSGRPGPRCAPPGTSDTGRSRRTATLCLGTPRSHRRSTAPHYGTPLDVCCPVRFRAV
jgi:hypothetical protein